MSVNYRKLYSYLVGEVDRALDLLDSDNLLQFYRVREILFNALKTTEDMYLDDTEKETGNKFIVLAGGKDALGTSKQG